MTSKNAHEKTAIARLATMITIKLLYIDDSPADLRFGYQLFESIQGYQVRVTSSKAPLVNVDEYGLYDLIVFDHNLNTVKKGSVHALEVAQAYPDIPVFLYSDSDDWLPEFVGIRARGVDGIMNKKQNDKTVEQLLVAFRNIARNRRIVSERRGAVSDRRKKNR